MLFLALGATIRAPLWFADLLATLLLRLVEGPSFPIGRVRPAVPFHKDNLSEDRKQQLEVIGFVWNPLKEQWNDWIEQFLAFKEKQGHCIVPNSFSGLGRWVANIRRRMDNLSEYRKRQLEAIGFIWNPFDEQWGRWIDQLLAYKEAHGHCVEHR